MYRLFPILCLLFFSFGSCLRTDLQQDYVDTLFSDAVQRFTVEVDYMQGAAPEVMQDERFAWQLLENNLDALMRTSKTLYIPKTLETMEEIPAKNQNYNRKAIFDVAIMHRNSDVFDGKDASLYILYLDGFFVDAEGEVKPSILGLSIPGLSMMTIFKPAIDKATQSLPQIKAITQQVVMIHELGHSLGLVNNGLPLTSAHLDDTPSHGSAHCSNPQCIMYWQNSGINNALFLNLEGDSELNIVLFGQECLLDVHTFLGNFDV